MSKSTIVEIIESGGNSYGQISSPADIVKAQEYAHRHVELVTTDFLTNVENAEVAGCDYLLTNGLNIQIGNGRIYRSGLQYEVAGKTVTLQPADPQYARIDFVIATLADNVPANIEFLAFQRLRTEQDFIESLPPYPPTQFQRATEQQNLGTISVKTGTAAANPLAPVLALNEVLLYTVTVPAGATELNNSNITDSRRKISNISGLTQELIDHLARLKKLEEQILVLVYRYPTILSGDGKVPATLLQDENSVWVIDIPIGIDVQFGDGFVKIRAEKFTDPTVNPRYVNISNGVITYLPLLEANGNPGNATTGNNVRFTVPATTKALYLNRDGELFFRDAILPSGPTECLLLKTVRIGSNPPTLKTYRNLRNSISNYSGTKAVGTAATFDLDLGVPVGVLYPDYYGEKAADGHRYSLPAPVVAFDSIVTVTGITDGDKWFVRMFILSAL